MPKLIEIDLSEWLDYIRSVDAVKNALPQGKKIFLQRTGKLYNTEIHSLMDSTNLDWTGTYRQSFRIDESKLGSDNPSISLTIDPMGLEADRLNIYWKAREFGTAPNIDVPKSRIVSWSSQKFGSPAMGTVVASLIRIMGTEARPILNTIFNLSQPEGEILGLTAHAESIAEQQLSILMKELLGVFETTHRTKGKSVTVLRNLKGQFASLKVR